jgi:hypothetical protein
MAVDLDVRLTTSRVTWYYSTTVVRLDLVVMCAPWCPGAFKVASGVKYNASHFCLALALPSLPLGHPPASRLLYSSRLAD